jgi:hypothetical protein
MITCFSANENGLLNNMIGFSTGVLKDFVFIMIIAVVMIFVYKRRQSVSHSIALFFIGISLAGLIGQVLELLSYKINVDYLNTLICLSLILCVLVFKSDLRTDSFVRRKISLSTFLLTAAAVLFTNIFSRMFASGQTTAVLTQFSILSGAEDNGGWTDVASQLVSGSKINFEQAGGPLVAFLSICQSLSRMFVFIFTGKENDLSSILNAVVIAYIVLLILSASCAANLAKQLTKMSKASSYMLALSVWLLVAGGIIESIDYGHLSYIFVAVVYLNSVWELTINRNLRRADRIYLILPMVLVQPVWLPLHVISFVMSAIVIYMVCKEIGVRDVSTSNTFASVLILSGPLMILYISAGAIHYTAQTVDQVENVLGASGGVSSPSSLFIASLLFCLVLIASLSKTNRMQLFIMYGFGFTYVIMVICADFWFTGTMNYGSTKLLNGFLLIYAPLAISVLLILLMEIGSPKNVKNILSLVVFGVMLVCLLVNSSSSIRGYISPKKWPATIETNPNYWLDSIIVRSEELKINDLPIGCVTQDASGDLWVDDETYFCSRTLSSVSGVWSENWMLIEFQLWPDRMRIDQLKQVPFELMGRKLLILDSVTHEVIGAIKVEDFKNYAIESY